MDFALSLVTLTIIALVLGAIALLRRGGYRKQAVLMLVLAAIMAGNVAIWSMPAPMDGAIDQAALTQKAPE